MSAVTAVGKDTVGLLGQLRGALAAQLEVARPAVFALPNLPQAPEQPPSPPGPGGPHRFGPRVDVQV